MPEHSTPPRPGLDGLVVCLGDLVEDIVVHLDGDIRRAADTPSQIVRHRGGSAANTAAAIARAGGRSRFVGRVGDDGVGRVLTDDLESLGVEVAVQRVGRTGSIVVVVDRTGERSMLTDRGAAPDLEGPCDEWFVGAAALHVPAYGLFGGSIESTARRSLAQATSLGLLTSIDVSSTSLVDAVGARSMLELLAGLDPDVVLCNEDEAASLGGGESVARALHTRTARQALLIVKHGARPAEVYGAPGVTGRVEVPAVEIAEVADTTGAGDAFTAGVLLALLAGSDPLTAVRSGHRTAAAELRRRAGQPFDTISTATG